MAAKLEVIVPAPGAFPSGGNVFNARVLDGLSNVPDAPELSLHLVRTGIALPVFEPGAHALVDTLLMAETEAALAHAARRALLVHHLELFEPATRDGPRARLERRLIQHYSSFITTSQWSARALHRIGLPGDIAVVHPGVDDDFIQRPPPERPADGPTRVLTVANLIPRKGLIELARKFAALEGVRFQWTVVGNERLDQTYARRFHGLIAELGLRDRVRVIETASSEVMRALYDTSDVLVSGARFETLGMALREAMARALPVLAWDVGGCGESVRDGESGYLVAEGDEAAFAARLRALIAEPQLRTELGARAREQALEFPSWHTVQARFAAALAAIAE